MLNTMLRKKKKKKPDGRRLDISDMGDSEVPGALTTLKRKKDILDLGR